MIYSGRSFTMSGVHTHTHTHRNKLLLFVFCCLAYGWSLAAVFVYVVPVYNGSANATNVAGSAGQTLSGPKTSSGGGY